MTRQALRVFLIDAGWCVCGNPDQACRALLRLLRLHPLNWNVYRDRSQLDAWITDGGVKYLLLYMLHSLGLTEHAETVSRAWLTAAGVSVLIALANEEADDFEALNEPHCVHGIDLDQDCSDCRSCSIERISHDH
jgi:hypothetical protein